MIRKTIFDEIEFRLRLLATGIEIRGGLNILDLHVHAENFYQHFFNLLFSWDLVNQNAVQQNAAALDLVDKKNKIVIQVSATATKQKIETALAKDLSAFLGYNFKFIAIAKSDESLRAKSYANPHGLTFVPSTDIYDVPSLLRTISAMPLTRQTEIRDFLQKELKNETDPVKAETNLAAIIKILTKENWSETVEAEYQTIPYDIEAKIVHNEIDETRAIIDEYKVQYNHLDKIYSEYDKQGVNKSNSVLNGIRCEYLKLGSAGTPDERFLQVIDKVMDRILQSANYSPLPTEEIRTSVEVLVVDAFIRCKIFKTPLKPNNAAS